MSVVVTAFPVPGHRAEVVVALADLRSALQGKLSVPSSVTSCVRWSWRRMPRASTRIQSVPGITRLALIRGPARVASATCQHSRAGDPVVGPSGPSIRSANVISYSRSIILLPLHPRSMVHRPRERPGPRWP